jgi:hypothetical protein
VRSTTAGDEPVVDGIFNYRAAGGGAFLTGGKEGRVHHVLDGGREVGVGEHNGRILAAHFELDTQAPFGSLAVQPVADLTRTGEGHGPQRLGVDQGLAQLSAEPATKLTTPLEYRPRCRPRRCARR